MRHGINLVKVDTHISSAGRQPQEVEQKILNKIKHLNVNLNLNSSALGPVLHKNISKFRRA
jgi:hypothetical protein